MARSNTNTLTRKPSQNENENAVSQATGDQPVTPVETSPKHDAVNRSVIKTGADLLAAARPTNRLLAKQELLTSVSQQLAEISDISADYDPQTGLNSRASELSNNVAQRLWHGQTTGLLTAAEVTDILGNQFGWRKKGDAKVRAVRADEQSKTPFGYGETIRKRITRAIKASAYVGGGDPDNFFSVIPRETVEEYVDEVSSGGLSIFTLYDSLQDERKELLADDDDRQPVNAAFDPKKVLKLVQALTEEGAADNFAENPSLLIAYASVTEAIEAITSALMARPDAEAIIAAVQAAPEMSAE